MHRAGDRRRSRQGSRRGAAGIKPGDRVTRIDDTAITDFQQLPEIISVQRRRRLAIGIHRGGQDLTIWVTPRLMQDPRHSGQQRQPDGDRGASRSQGAGHARALRPGGRLWRSLFRDLEHHQEHGRWGSAR